MNRNFWFAVLAAVSSPLAMSQDTSYEGTWVIKVDGKRAVDLGGKVVIQGQAGTWNVVARQSSNPCVGREYPLVVKSASAEQIVVEVERAKTLQGCKDSTYTFRRTDPSTLEGDFGAGRTAVLRRE